MKIVVSLSGMKPFSKQHSGGRCGNRYFVKPEYSAWKKEVAIKAQQQAKKQKWIIPPRKAKLQMVISAYGAGRMDVDNLAGGIMDALIGVLYEDDHQIRRLISETWPSTDGAKPAIYVTVEIIEAVGERD